MAKGVKDGSTFGATSASALSERRRVGQSAASLRLQVRRLTSLILEAYPRTEVGFDDCQSNE